MKKHTEYIICPNCQSIQIAEVKHTFPWWDYTHICNECEYMTMESEWQNCHNIKFWQKIMLRLSKLFNRKLGFTEKKEKFKNDKE